MRAIVLRCTIRPVRACTFALPELSLDTPANYYVMIRVCVAGGCSYYSFLALWTMSFRDQVDQFIKLVFTIP